MEREIMKQSITWGALVGVALGATVTLALSRGWLELPWSSPAALEGSAPAAMHDETTPGAGLGVAPLRPLRPGGLRLGDVAAAAGPSRS